jgi:polygalacturonase
VIDRRDFLRSLATVSALACFPALVDLAAQGEGRSDNPADILKRIRAPRFPDRDFDVRRYGAASDGRTDCRAAMARAIAECHASGGGRVIVPAGTYLCNGPIHLASHVNLHLEQDATILFGTNPADYLPVVLVRWESTRCYNYSPLIYAFQQVNVAITGRGTLDGQAHRSWSEWKQKQAPDQEALRAMGRTVTPVKRRVFGAGHYMRPTMCEWYDCRNVLLEGITLKGSPFWTVHPVFCTNVTVRGIHVLPGTTNDDGCDPDSCRDVLIEDCVFDTADDNIAIKAGRDQDAWGGRPCENVVIRRCKGVRSAANGYTIGSEMSGGVRNVWILDSEVGQVATNALYVKSNTDRGGVVENVWMRGIRAEACDRCVRLETDYKGVVGHPYPSRYRNLHFEDVSCRTARKSGISSVGIETTPIEGVYLKDIIIENAATDLEITHTRRLEMQNVTINGRLLRAPTADTTRGWESRALGTYPTSAERQVARPHFEFR